MKKDGSNPSARGVALPVSGVGLDLIEGHCFINEYCLIR